MTITVDNVNCFLVKNYLLVLFFSKDFKDRNFAETKQYQNFSFVVENCYL
jgi:hypothetical protein